MKALLYYDLRRNYLWILYLFIITFFLSRYSNTIFLIYYVLSVCDLVIKTFPLNRSEGFEKRIYTFPINPKDIVLGKYLYFASILLVGLIGYLTWVLTYKFLVPILKLKYFWIGNLVTIIIVSNILPRIFRNRESSDEPDISISLISIISIFGIITLLLTLLQNSQLTNPLLQTKYLMIFSFIAVALIINSYFRSLNAIEENYKEFTYDKQI